MLRIRIDVAIERYIGPRIKLKSGNWNNRRFEPAISPVTKSAKMTDTPHAK